MTQNRRKCVFVLVGSVFSLLVVSILIFLLFSLSVGNLRGNNNLRRLKKGMEVEEKVRAFSRSEYTCSATCSCEEEYLERRNLLTLSNFPKTISFSLAAVSLGVAYVAASKHFEGKCKSLFSKQCSESSIFTDEIECQMLFESESDYEKEGGLEEEEDYEKERGLEEDEDEDDTSSELYDAIYDAAGKEIPKAKKQVLEEGEEYWKYRCIGHCLTRKTFKYSMLVDQAEAFNCEEIITTKEVFVPISKATTFEKYDSATKKHIRTGANQGGTPKLDQFAKNAFRSFHLTPLCKAKSRMPVSFLVEKNGEKKMQRGSRILCTSSSAAKNKNRNISCEKIGEVKN